MKDMRNRPGWKITPDTNENKKDQNFCLLLLDVQNQVKPGSDLREVAALSY